MKKLGRYLLRVAAFAVLSYLVFHVIYGDWGLMNYLRARRDRVRLEKQFLTVKNEKERTTEEVSSLKNDPRFIEEQIKIQLKKGRKGEIFYYFPDKQ